MGRDPKNMRTTIKTLKSLVAVSSVMALEATLFGQSTTNESVIDPALPPMQGGSLRFGVPQFNPSLGTLNSVDFTITPIFGYIQPWDSAAIPQTITDASVNSPRGTLADSALGLTESWSGAQYPSGQLENVVISNPGSFGYGAPQTFSFTGPPSSINGADPTGFTGTGDVLVSFATSASATSRGMGTGMLAFSWVGTIGGELDITYNYTPSPVSEPATIGLLAGGLLGALSIRRKA